MSKKTFIALSQSLILLALCQNSIAENASFLKKLLPYELPPEKITLSMVSKRSSPMLKDKHGTNLIYLTKGPFRRNITLENVNNDLIKYLINLEDAKFYTHSGFDTDEIKNSIVSNLKAGKIKRGGSTISQQLVKNLFLDKKKKISRKLFEIPWVNKLEKSLSKKQILNSYLNIIEWGPKIYGAEAAAHYYYGKSNKDLSPIEAMYLALIVPNPKKYDLHKHPTRLKFLNRKKNTFVARLLAEKIIDLEQKQYLTSSELYVGIPPFKSNLISSKSSHLESVGLIFDKYRAKGDLLSSLDNDMQLKLHQIQPTQLQEPEAKSSRYWAIKSKNSDEILAFKEFKTSVFIELEPKNTDILVTALMKRPRAKDLAHALNSKN